MMHTTGRSVLRRGPWALGNLALSFIAITAIGGRAEAQPRAFVANTNANTVTVVDTVTDNPDARTSFGVGAAPGPIVIGKDGRAFVANTGANSISIVDADKNLVDTIATNEHPVSLALSPDGATVYVMDIGGYLETCRTTLHDPCASLFIGGSSNARLAVTSSGDRVFIASDLIYELDTKTGHLSSFIADASVSPDHANFPVDIAILPDGRLYIAVVTYYNTWRGFSAGGGVVVVDPSGDTPVVTQTIDLFSLPGPIALSADGTRAFVGIQWDWADTLYGAAFMPGQWVATIDTGSNVTIAWTDLGAESTSVAGTHVPAGLAVAPDRSAVFVSVPNIDSLLEIGTRLEPRDAALPVRRRWPQRGGRAAQSGGEAEGLHHRSGGRRSVGAAAGRLVEHRARERARQRQGWRRSGHQRERDAVAGVVVQSEHHPGSVHRRRVGWRRCRGRQLQPGLPDLRCRPCRQLRPGHREGQRPGAVRAARR